MHTNITIRPAIALMTLMILLVIAPAARAATPADVPRFQAAAEQAKANNHPASRIDALVSLAGAYQSIGQVTLAMTTLDESLSTANRMDELSPGNPPGCCGSASIN